MRKIYGKVYGNVLRMKLQIKLHNLQRNYLFKTKDCKISTDFKYPVQDCKRVAGPSFSSVHSNSACSIISILCMIICHWSESASSYCISYSQLASYICNQTFVVAKLYSGYHATCPGCMASVLTVILSMYHACAWYVSAHNYTQLFCMHAYYS